MNKHIGSTLDSLLEDLGELEETDLLATKKMLAEDLQLQMKSQSVTKSGLAGRMKTSRSHVHRLLDPEDTGITLGTIARASAALGLRLSVKLDRRPTAQRGGKKQAKVTAAKGVVFSKRQTAKRATKAPANRPPRKLRTM
jgi:antitoxin HicB